jgi:S1-C subfamily serine protease
MGGRCIRCERPHGATPPRHRHDGRRVFTESGVDGKIFTLPEGNSGWVGGMTDETPGADTPETWASASAPSGRSPWPRVVLTLGITVVIAAAAVAGVALWPRETTPLSATPSASPTTTTPTPTATPIAEPELSAAELALRFGDAVWRVAVDRCGVPSGGSAFMVGPRTLITNAHVVVGDATPTVTSRDGRTTFSTAVAGADPDLDVAVLITDRDLPGEPLDWIAADELTEGQNLVALGYPVPDSSFTVAPATLMSFQVQGTTRQALRLDGRMDHGNSGGPALTTSGQVAGVVTRFLAPEEHGGRQLLVAALTHDYLAAAIRSIERDHPGMTVNCDQPPAVPTLPDEWDWEWDDTPDRDTDTPDSYGDDPYFDGLWDACAGGNMAACDDLYFESPLNSNYEHFGATCGGIGHSFGTCTWDHDNEPEWWPSDAIEYGDSVYLDGLWDACASGDMDACDTLYYDSPLGSDYEQFGATCGGRDHDAWPGHCDQE